MTPADERRIVGRLLAGSARLRDVKGYSAESFSGPRLRVLFAVSTSFLEVGAVVTTAGVAAMVRRIGQDWPALDADVAELAKEASS